MRNRIAAAIAAAALALGAVALAQEAPAQSLGSTLAPPEATSPAAPAEAPAQAGAATGAADPAETIRRALSDPATRAALIEALVQAIETPAGAAGAPQPDSAQGSTPPAGAASTAAPEAAAEGGAAAPGAQQTIGHLLAEGVREAGWAAIEQGRQFLAGLQATQRRLALLGDGDRARALLATFQPLLVLIVATIGAHVVLRAGARRIWKGRAAALSDAPLLSRGAVWVVRLIADVLAVLVAWAIGYALMFGALADLLQTGGNGIPAALYLNAFLISQMARVAVRATLAPGTPSLRLLPFDDAGARYWNGRIGWLLSILGYGLLFVTPIVAQTVSVFTARAVSVVVYAIALLWSMALVVRWRQAPSQWLSRRAEAANGDGTLRALAAVMRFWHWPALAYLVLLFMTAVSRSADVGPILSATGKAIVALAIGAALGGLLARGARHGVRLSPELNAQAPLLEQRLNDFLVRLLGAARLILTVGAISVAISVSGLYDTWGWFERRFGEDFAGVAISALVIVTVAFMMWLALASWVDWRLSPERPVPATARERTLLTLLRNAATIAIAVITLMVTLSELGLDIAPLLASAGVLGLAIGFGAQRMVQDIITGIFIQFENAINVGDVVTVAGVTGTVEKLTIRSVSLRDVQGVFHIIPFSSVDMVSNFMRGFSFHVADIGIAYREDVDEAKRLMHAAFDDVKADPAFGRDILGPLDWFGVNALGDSAVVLRARIRTRPGAQWGVGRAYNEAVKKRFDAAGVEIPFPHMTVWFGENKDGSAPPARVANQLTAASMTTPVAPGAPARTEDEGRAAAAG